MIRKQIFIEDIIPFFIVFLTSRSKSIFNTYCQALKHILRFKYYCFIFEFYDKKGQETFSISSFEVTFFLYCYRHMKFGIIVLTYQCFSFSKRPFWLRRKFWLRLLSHASWRSRSMSIFNTYCQALKHILRAKYEFYDTKGQDSFFKL